MDDHRFTRLEQRVDEIKDDVSELKADGKIQKESINHLSTDIRSYAEDVKAHVAGDEKIITELKPLLETLPEMINQFNYEKQKRVEKDEKVKYWASRLGLITLSVGIVTGAYKLLSVI